MAELESLVKDFPELVHVALRRQRDVWQVDGDYALVNYNVPIVSNRADYLFTKPCDLCGTLRVVINSTLLGYIHRP